MDLTLTHILCSKLSLDLNVQHNHNFILSVVIFISLCASALLHLHDRKLIH